MINRVRFFVICGAILATLTGGPALGSGLDYGEMDRALSKKLNPEKVPDKDRLYLLYQLAGRDFYNHGQDKLAEKYYRLATGLDSIENQSESYLTLVAIELNRNDKAAGKEQLALAQSYFSTHPSFKNRRIENLLVVFEGKLLDGKGPHAKELEALKKGGFYAEDLRWDDVERLIRKRDFIKAYAMLNPSGFRSSPLSQQIVVDLLNVVVNRKSAINLLCSDSFSRHPTSFAYTTKICGLLLGYVKAGTLDADKLKDLEAYFQKRDTDKAYLADALRELAHE